MRRLIGAASGFALVLVVSPAAHADRIHLEGGGVIEADTWTEDGDTLRIEGPSGSYGIPRSMVVRIERTPAGRPNQEPARQARPPITFGDGLAAQRPRVSTPPPGPLPSRQDERLHAIVAEGREALATKDYERAASRFHEALAIAPALTGLRVGYAFAEMALGRDPLALPVVLDGLSRDPGSADLHELLGDLRDREERVDDALAAWREAFRLAPNDRLLSKIQKAERELHAGRDYAFSAAAHFNLRYDGDLDRALTGEILDALEERFAELSGAFRHAPSQPITVLLYPTQQFRDVTQTGEGVGGVYDGKIRVPLGGITRLDDRARRVLVHELAHAFVHSKTRGSCPRWLHEGIAQRFEGRRPTRADGQRVRSLLASGDPASWEARGFTYPAALSLSLFLESLRGWDGLLDVLDRLERGESLSGAFEAAYGSTYADLCRRWAESFLEESGR